MRGKKKRQQNRMIKTISAIASTHEKTSARKQVKRRASVHTYIRGQRLYGRSRLFSSFRFILVLSPLSAPNHQL
ncbi:hypothetical protein BX666DRAFT_1950292 [Dichotomocladium elegans]|nr:hypothetical protein BX666DRAFT_1950292 [Dichotomocladium elegans]